MQYTELLKHGYEDERNALDNVAVIDIEKPPPVLLYNYKFLIACAKEVSGNEKYFENYNPKIYINGQADGI